MKLLVTGGAGYIGSVVAGQLLMQGHRIVVLDNLSSGSKDSVPAGAELYVGDVGSRGDLNEVLPGVDGVLHFAASIDVGASMKHPIKHFANNVRVTIELLEAMLNHDVRRFIFSSTAAVYGHPQTMPVTENHPLRPTNPYGESKLMVERILARLHDQNGLRYASLRYFNAAGGPAKEGSGNLIPLVLRVADGDLSHIKIFGTDYSTRDGTAVRDYIHVDDLSAAHLLVLEALDHRSKAIYNLGSGTGFSVLEVIAAAQKVTGRHIPVISSPRRPGDPAEIVASSSAIGQELGWSPRFTSLESIVESAWKSRVRL